MSAPEKRSFWQSRSEPAAGLAPESKAAARVAVACNIAAMGVMALLYSRIWEPNASRIVVWLMVLIVALAVGAMIAGVLVAFTRSLFWKRWMTISWAALGLMVFNAWNK